MKNIYTSIKKVFRNILLGVTIVGILGGIVFATQGLEIVSNYLSSGIGFVDNVDSVAGSLGVAATSFHSKQNGSWLAWPVNGYNYIRGTTYLSGTLYDEQNSAYYVDPAATSNFNILTAATPTASGQVATKAYVDAAVAAAGGGFTVNDLDNDKYLAYYSGATQAGSPTGYDCKDSSTVIGATVDGGLCDGDNDGQVNMSSVIGKAVYSIPSSLKSSVDCNDDSATESDNCVIKDPSLTMPNGNYYVRSTVWNNPIGYVRFTLYNKLGKALRSNDFYALYSSTAPSSLTDYVRYVMNANGDLLLSVSFYNAVGGGYNVSDYILRANGALNGIFSNVVGNSTFSALGLANDGITFCSAFLDNTNFYIYGYVDTTQKTFINLASANYSMVYGNNIACDTTNLYIPLYDTTLVSHYLVKNGSLVTSGPGFQYTTSMKIGDSGNLYILGQNGLYKFNSSGGAIWNVTYPGSYYYSSLSYDGTNMYALDWSGKKLYTINQSNGSMTNITFSNLGNPCTMQYNGINYILNGNYIDTTVPCIFTGY